MNAAQIRFFLSWAVWSLALAFLAALLLAARLQPMPLNGMIKAEIPILWLRTIAYLCAIVLFPLIGEIKRRIEVSHRDRSKDPNIPADQATQARSSLPSLIIALVVAESIGILGFALFLLGDTLQTLYIFLGMSALGLLLHRPKLA